MNFTGTDEAVTVTNDRAERRSMPEHPYTSRVEREWRDVNDLPDASDLED